MSEARVRSQEPGTSRRSRLLVVGGAGYVGSLLLPYLAAEHDVVVLDLTAPAATDVDHVIADITAPDHYGAVRSAAEDADAVVFLAMGGGVDSPAAWSAHLGVAVPGTYAMLRAAHESGVDHVVFASSLSVFNDWKRQQLSDRTLVPGDARGVYGLSKRLAEVVCANAVAEWGMSVVSLRMALPTPDHEWPREEPGEVVLSVSASNLAAAFLAALDYRPAGGYDALLITGDTTGERVDSRRTQKVLGWRPDPWPQTHANVVSRAEDQ